MLYYVYPTPNHTLFTHVPARMHVGLANARLPFVGQGFIRAGDGLFDG
jgi:hypothetical protein